MGSKTNDRRESFKHNPADAHDARPMASLNLANHLVELLRLLWVHRPNDRRESFKHNPVDAHDARPMGSLNLANHSVERLRQPIGERVSSTIQLMRMMLAPWGSLNLAKHSVELLRLLWVQRPTIGERVSSTIQLMLMMLAPWAPSIWPITRSNGYANRSEREFEAQSS